MKEGWHEDAYYVLFDDQESTKFTAAYGLDRFLPGYKLIGLRSWDDLIVVKSTGEMFTVPSVPATEGYLSPCAACALPMNLARDEQLFEKIKWYITPLVFGGDPGLGENIVWVPIDKHAELVNWWNERYREVRRTASHQ